MRSIKLQKRSFLDRIFGKQLQNIKPQLFSVQMLSGYNNKIMSFNSDIYNDDTVRSCVDTIARHFAKMKAEHRLKNIQTNSQLNKLLSLRPNPDMSSYDFLYKLVTALELDNNAYVYIKRDSLGNVLALYPILYNQAELKENKAGQQFLEFTFLHGQRVSEPIDNIIVLRKHFYKNDFFGESNIKPLNPALSLLSTIRQGIENAIKNSAVIRGILQATGMLNDEDISKKRDNFKGQFLDSTNNGGIIVSDSTDQFTPLEMKPTLVDDKQMSLAQQKIYNYFGVSESIVKGTYSDAEWNAFYEGILEPLAIMFQQEFTQKIFSQREIDFGNTVNFVADKLAYLNIDSKQKLFQCVKELGVANKGTICEIFNLPLPPDPEVYLQSLNYIDRGIVNDYQLGTKQITEEGNGDNSNEQNTTT